MSVPKKKQKPMYAVLNSACYTLDTKGISAIADARQTIEVGAMLIRM